MGKESEILLKSASSLGDLLVKTSWYQTLCLFVWVFNIYTELPLVLPGEKFVPAFLLLPSMVLIWPFVANSLRLRHLFFSFAIFTIALISVLTKWDFSLLTTSVIKLLQFLYSLILFSITFVFLKEIDTYRLRKFLFLFSIIIVIGCMLERIGLISGITNAYRTLYSGTNYGGEIDLDREVFISGFVRPYFFTSEPSMVGLGFFSLSTAWALLNSRPALDILMGLLGVLMLIVLASPSVVLSPVLIFLIAMRKYKVPINRMTLYFGIAVAIFVSVVSLGLLDAVWNPLVMRFSQELMREGTSLYVRIYVPYMQTIPTVLAKYPLFGVGYGNHGLINVIFGYNFNMDEDETLFLRGANGFANFFTYLGLLGSGLIFWLLYRFHVRENVKYFLLTFLFMFFAGQITGTFSTPKIWCFTALFMACGQLAFSGADRWHSEKATKEHDSI